MNRPIMRLYGLVAVLFLLLVAFTSRWTVFDASSLRHSPLNVRGLLAQERIQRGTIRAADGTVLAHSVRSREGTYTRTYPLGERFANAIGYAYAESGQLSGLELSRNGPLSGETQENFQTILNQLQGKHHQGNELITTLQPKAQQVAQQALGSYEGAVVALEPKTGAVTVMASNPSFNPSQTRTAQGLSELNHSSGAPLFNRATEGGYAPGSTFKVITATAAIDSGQFTPLSTLSGRNDILISGVPLGNDNNDSFGEITLTKALAESVNTVWAQVATKLGKSTMARYMQRFGFDHKPQLDYPTGEMSASGEYFNGRLTSPRSELVDVGRMGIGQDHLEVTPLQMAEVAAAVANHGKLMVPYLTQRIVNPEGATIAQTNPRVQAAVMKPSSASAVTEMMEAVVNEGTGTTARIPGIQVAGKTGTAETQVGQSTNNVWFIAFAPASNPTVAVAATIAHAPGYGATYAAPVAKAVMEALLK
ncbi:MAG: peptidoglycan D,D-transpeptidase FtsI family protein [Solirubrobacteraceae bacterium]